MILSFLKKEKKKNNRWPEICPVHKPQVHYAQVQTEFKAAVRRPSNTTKAVIKRENLCLLCPNPTFNSDHYTPWKGFQRGILILTGDRRRRVGKPALRPASFVHDHLKMFRLLFQCRSLYSVCPFAERVTPGLASSLAQLCVKIVRKIWNFPFDRGFSFFIIIFFDAEDNVGCSYIQTRSFLKNSRKQF